MFPLFQLTCLAIVSSITTPIELESSCYNKCQLTWTRNVKNSNFCFCGLGQVDGQPGCAKYSVDATVVAINTKYCMTFDEESNVSYVGKCPYNSLLFHQYNNVVTLPQDVLKLNNFMCNVSNFTGHNYFCGQQRRQGLLCGKCEKGLGPAVLSYTHPCVECQWYGWLLYLTLSFVPTTVLCVLVIILRINVLSPPLNAIVFFCHIMVSHVNYMPCRFLYYANLHHLSSVVIIVLTIYGFFNMDFLVYVLPPFCISNKLSTLTVIALDYSVALYPLVLSVMVYLLIEVHDKGCWPLVWVWRPVHRCLFHLRRSWDIKGSTINAFATLYVLSFMKVISTCVNLMLSTPMANTCGTDSTKSHLYYNASCCSFQSCHRPYVILTFIVAIIFIILPLLFLFLHPCKLFHKYRCFPCHSPQLANEIAKIFQRSFKDGTDNTNDYRWFAGIYLLIRIAVATSMNWRTPQQIQAISSIAGVMLVAIFQPHSFASYNVLDSFLFASLGIIFMLLPSSNSHHITQVLIFFIPLLLIIVFICYKIIQKYLSSTSHQKILHLHLLPKVGNILSRLSIESNNSTIRPEQKPLVDKAKSSVSYTVVDIKD